MEKDLILKQYQSLIEGIDNEISVLANTSAFLNEILEDVSWVGFYLYDHEKLILGPFQGKIACTSIPMNKGVCGVSAYKKETLLVEDVHKFEGHIACDSASNSEIVIPILVDDYLYGVLDLDSTSFARFKKDDQILLEAIVKLLETYLSSDY
ncbi:L-methionine (R)-S-oxide reductase [Breznakia sp. PF5-3]|uniref:GAF domain-containing protein n=1 Tax=unclassified Breznakia TaxID=2623764 RepID=UPI0024054911|nr:MULTISPECIES: GAF domain-containing protein [unclassified Breznakia]MDF9824481.1 L-methionine (R)-S-oxide reductase [Breznakia sp. PM6-1]MDF9835236.1 L-methionine (R)-S-oxide reductase [Breznakia sp. PF5-3]MDF9837436.1 L-methionine (R)-S-oxide reductase [Breznakia sp. PFB2-8]MDF9859372.1 L-methionine (R)-S-oxide reductase [Breznakia sp. PH5-24]